MWTDTSCVHEIAHHFGIDDETLHSLGCTRWAGLDRAGLDRVGLIAFGRNRQTPFKKRRGPFALPEDSAIRPAIRPDS